MIATQPQIANKILAITKPATNAGFPSSSIDAANKWADVAELLFAAVIPISTGATAGRAAFISVMQGVSNSVPNGLIILKSAFQAYSVAIAIGMLPLFTGTPPAGLPPLESAIGSNDADITANIMATVLVTWAKTGTSVLVAPPNTFATWQ
jgi:hypothetical protein